MHSWIGSWSITAHAAQDIQVSASQGIWEEAGQGQSQLNFTVSREIARNAFQGKHDTWFDPFQDKR